MVLTFDNAFAHTNVYGHALSLLNELCTPGNTVHLDVGCGFGRIAEPLVSQLQRHYIGVDMDMDGLMSLSHRGFETHQLTLGAHKANIAALEAILAGRQLGSITMLDTLEHLHDPSGALQALRGLAAKDSVPVIVSVPNVAHRDLGFKLLVGRFDYTEAGLLDHTHISLFTEKRLIDLGRRAGLHQLGARDVYLEPSDQCFPPDHIALAPGALLHKFLNNVRDGADSFGSINQFVRAFAAGEAHISVGYASREAKIAPFLSVITRTQGNRPDALRDVFTTLMGQSSTNFEVLVMGHRLDIKRQLLVERAIADNPTWLRERVRLIMVNHGGRAAPLNVGFGEACGRYVSILDDDDLVFGHWVETFEKLAVDGPGTILRTRCVRQFSEVVYVSGHELARAVSGFDRLYSADFDLAAHLSASSSPGLALAYPRSVFADFGLRFDELLSTNEDWDFLMRALPLCGLTNSPEITSIYRWWINRTASLQAHPMEEWELNHAWARNKLDAQPFLIPSGGTRRIRELYTENVALRDKEQKLWRENEELRRVNEERHRVNEELHRVNEELHRVNDELQGVNDELRHQEQPGRLRAHLDAIYKSSSWRYTRPMRTLGRFFGRPPALEANPEDLTTIELNEMIEKIRQSISWRAMGPLRLMVRRIRRNQK